MKCPRCQKNKAGYHKTFGVMLCDSCSKDDEQVSFRRSPEFWSITKMDRIRTDREVNAKDILQPWNADGKPNSDFIKAYPDEARNYMSRDQIVDGV